MTRKAEFVARFVAPEPVHYPATGIAQSPPHLLGVDRRLLFLHVPPFRLAIARLSGGQAVPGIATRTRTSRARMAVPFASSTVTQPCGGATLCILPKLSGIGWRPHLGSYK